MAAGSSTTASSTRPGDQGPRCRPARKARRHLCTLVGRKGAEVSELRWHPFLEQWVITATHRQDRTFLPPADYCPLCPTRPGGFPTEVPEPTYDIVVFENKFPSLQAAPPEPAVAATSLSPVEPAKGVCEVVVYSPRHEDALASMPLERIQHLARVWKDRHLELGARDFVRYVFIFENRGEAAGVARQPPTGGEAHRLAHLHFEFYTPQRAPDRLKFLAGVESGAGNFINDKLAEESAAELRRVGPASVAAVRAADEAGRERAPVGIGGGMGHDPAAPRPASSMADALRTAFGPGGTAVTAFAPGRVNLIGEHTDYNDGFVLPMAIEDGIEMAARSRAGREIRAHAVDLGETVAFSLEQPIRPDPTRPWSNYIRGVLWALSRAGVALGGMDLAFGGTLPQGAGLSSSAALQVATALTARALLRFTMDVPRLARLFQESEDELVGVEGGIMDPFVSLAAREGHALFLDCRSLAFEQVPLALGDHVVAICYSGVKHALVASEYNLRRRH